MIRSLIYLYILVIIIDVMISYFPEYRFKPWAQKIHQWANFTLAPVRKYLPKDLPFDFSPLVVIISLKVIMLVW